MHLLATLKIESYVHDHFFVKVHTIAGHFFTIGMRRKAGQVHPKMYTIQGLNLVSLLSVLLVKRGPRTYFRIVKMPWP